MTQRKCKMISIYQNDQERLDQLTESLGMKESEIIRYAIIKLAEDKTMQQIVLQKFLKEEGGNITRDRLLRIMSVKQTLKKDAPPQCRDAKAQVSVSTSSLLDFSKWGGLQQALEIAKEKWIDE